MQAGCVICQDPFDDAVGIVTTKCGHVFHNHCIELWLARSFTCPECRRSVSRSNLTKLFFTSFDNLSGNNPGRSLDALKAQLHTKEEEIVNKDKKIKDLQTYCARSEREANRLHQKKLELQNDLSSVKRELQGLNRVEANNQKLLQENNVLQSELEHLNNVKTIVEGSYKDADMVLKEMQVNLTCEEAKVVAKKLADYCLTTKRELSCANHDRAHLCDELTKIKKRMGESQLKCTKKIQRLEEQLKKLDLNSPISQSASRRPSSSSNTVGVLKSGCENPVTPITFDFPESNRFKMNIVVLDRETGKVLTQAPESPILRLANSWPSRRNPEIEDSVSRVGYDGLGGHRRVVTGSGGGKRAKPSQRQVATGSAAKRAKLAEIGSGAKEAKLKPLRKQII